MVVMRQLDSFQDMEGDVDLTHGVDQKVLYMG